MKKETYKSNSPEDTKNIAGEILNTFVTGEREGALVFALQGELGSGKTNFIKGAGEYMGIERNITSPTFVLMKRYTLPASEHARINIQGLRTLYHFDCYRVQESKEIEDLGWRDIISNPANIVFVEWPEHISDIIPENAIWIEFENKGGDKRSITVTL